MIIKIDMHEPDKIKQYLQDSKYCDFIIETLPIGDIICEEKSVIIERKSYPDFVGSFKSGHLQKQLLQMCDSCEVFLPIPSIDLKSHSGALINSSIVGYFSAIDFANFNPIPGTHIIIFKL